MLATIRSRRLYYDLLGPSDAPAVCFMHSLASDGGMWAEQVAPVLAARFRVLRVDMRGHGGSEASDGPYSMEDLADDAAALLQLLDIERAHVVGLSVGAMLAQALAIRDGKRCASLVLCDAQASAPASARGAWSAPLALVRQSKSLVPVRGGMMRAWLSDDFKEKNPARFNQIAATLVATSPVGFEGCVAAMSDFDFTADLPSLRVPTLCICGADDPMTPPAANQRLAALIPGARYEEIAGARHFVNVERADVFNEFLVTWLNAAR